jgi:hypothetical protein
MDNLAWMAKKGGKLFGDIRGLIQQKATKEGQEAAKQQAIAVHNEQVLANLRAEVEAKRKVEEQYKEYQKLKKEKEELEKKEKALAEA